MKIAILHPFLTRYARGIERFTWSLSGALASKGVEVDIITWQWPNPINWGSVPSGVRIFRMPYLRYFMAKTAIMYYLYCLKHEKYDFVIVFFAGYGEAESLTLLRKLCDQKYCIIFHYPYDQVPHRYDEFKRFGLARKADRLIAVSEHVAKNVRSEFGRECTVINNGVDAEVFHSSSAHKLNARLHLGISPDASVLVSLTALEERKGVQWVIRAIPYLLKDFPQLHYFILGEGSFRAHLETEIQQLGVEREVRLIGDRSDVSSYLSAADAGCLLSYGEAFPIALLEYMAMELPVITSCHPPFDELVKPEFGSMVNETDTESFAHLLRSLLSDPVRRQAMGQAGRKVVLAQYSWKTIADNYLRVLTNPLHE